MLSKGLTLKGTSHILHTNVNSVYLIFPVLLPDLFFPSFSLSFFQKDLPLPRKNSRWVLPPFIPLSPPCSLGTHRVPPWRKTITPGEAAEHDVVLTAMRMLLWCGECLCDWGGGRLLGVCVSLIKASQELWRLSMVLKAILPVPATPLLFLYLPSSLPIARLLICFCSALISSPSAFQLRSTFPYIF